MANFDKAFKFMLPHEIIVGKIVYTDDEKDRGGETCYGISRKYHPDWQGWDIIDEYKNEVGNDAELQQTLISNDELFEKAYIFFKLKFWDKLRGDDINNQDVANKFFDLTVNIGFKTILFMQKAIREASSNGNSLQTVVLRLDGKMGPNTLTAINRVMPRDLIAIFINNCVEYYKSKNNLRFEAGWIKRALDE